MGTGAPRSLSPPGECPRTHERIFSVLEAQTLKPRMTDTRVRHPQTGNDRNQKDEHLEKDAIVPDLLF